MDQQETVVWNIKAKENRSTVVPCVGYKTFYAYSFRFSCILSARCWKRITSFLYCCSIMVWSMCSLVIRRVKGSSLDVVCVYMANSFHVFLRACKYCEYVVAVVFSFRIVLSTFVGFVSFHSQTRSL